MKFLLTLILLLVSTPQSIHGNEHHIMPCSDAGIQYLYIQEETNNDIQHPIKELNNALFELPQQGTIQIQRNGEHYSTRRCYGQDRTGNTLAIIVSQQHRTYQISSNHKAVAHSRHCRGYYIYALRHIII